MARKITLVALILAGAATGAQGAVEGWFGQAVAVRDKYRELIRGADNDVAVAMDRFTDYALADALIDAARRGRRVRVIVDGDRRNLLKGKALGDHLKAGGVEVMYDRSESNLYDRFVVIDDHTVVVGSYPFIEDAPASPLTDAVVIEDKDVAKQYLEFFDFAWNLTK
jgi:phosphatidylserine/phosphatidylglycerophosphate/cardiolipin synthase-like enzyme